MLRLDYTPADGRAKFSWAEVDKDAAWVAMLKRVAYDATPDTSQEHALALSLPWWVFAGARTQFMQVFRLHGLKLGEGLVIGDGANNLLQTSRSNAESYRKASGSNTLAQSDLSALLEQRGFARKLSTRQQENVSRIGGLPAAATFSVPGAGKTTEALAYFFLRAQTTEHLLVVAPKNAFSSWDEQIQSCLGDPTMSFARLRGGREGIKAALSSRPRFMLITYQQLARVTDVIAAHLAQHRSFVFLDESHRIKAGPTSSTARAALSLSHLPVGKLVMSGTPMPQSVEDLVPQFHFLYPEIIATSDTVVDLMRPIYVRTNKAQLKLPPITRQLIQLPMAPVQAELYSLMRFEVAREASAVLDNRGRQAFRSLGRSVSRLLQFTSNPSLLAADIGFAHKELLAAVLAEGEGPKLDYVLRQARRLSRNGKKVLIWSSFVRNVEYMTSRLADLGAVFIHGGVDAGDEEDSDTREGKIKAFHDDENVRVMVANPAAASEGVSLHMVCHHAIYLDRTFNAAHYLQSEDRIHRFGLPDGQETIVEIVECAGSVDETVRTRLGFKIGQMAAALEDSSLSPDPIPIDPADDEAEDAEEYVTGLQLDDVRELVQSLGGAH
jgi:SNF2 family DNA or RNA helicase